MWRTAHTRPARAAIALLLAAWLCDPGAVRGESLEHPVAPGETLGAIARHHGVSLAEILALNPGLDPDRVRAGQRIAIDAGRDRVQYTVQPGDTMLRIAQAHAVSVAELLRWNPPLDPDRIRAGRQITVYPNTPASRSESIGSPVRGQIVHARMLPAAAGYAVREPARAWGTDETVRSVVAAFAHVRAQHGDVPRVWVHDLSLRSGGPIDDHKSHQSGRDVDIAYPQKRCPSQGCGFRRLAPADLDAAVAFTLLQYWLERDLLEAVFIDYRLQAPLYREARARGASASELARWFQYPRGRSERLAVVRHFPKHADHMHVRFACHPSDLACKSFRPLLLHATR
jgi:LysM repeat protein